MPAELHLRPIVETDGRPPVFDVSDDAYPLVFAPEDDAADNDLPNTRHVATPSSDET